MEFTAKQTLFFLSSVLFLCAAADHHAPEVHTKLGSLRGEYVTVKGKDTGVHAFLGVPFAKPPLGPALRLSPPQPVDGWEGVKDATKQPPMCPQNKEYNIWLFESVGGILKDIPNISEDCLYLNIYTPADRANNAKLPVMVWIHGGSFIVGSASTYDGSALAAYENVVVVVIQYRLGVLGFLSTGDEHMSGNFGLLDQVLALKWIQEHIHNFGGDPGLVTIFGEAAGGVSASLHFLTPLSEGLFHHAIAGSGTAAMDSLIKDDPLPMAKVIANLSGCSLESTKKFADCIKNLDINTIVAIAEDKSLRYPVNVDGHFLRKPVAELFHEHELLTKPFIAGVNNDEGGWSIGHIFAPPNWTEGMDREQIMQIVSRFYPDPKDEIRRDLIVDEYAGTGEDRVSNRKAFTELLGDLLYNFPAIKAANAHRDAGGPVYLYQYCHPYSFLQAIRPSYVDCDHGDDVLTILGFCFTTSQIEFTDKCNEEEDNLSKIIMNYFANFARTGNPNGKGLVHWPKYGADEEYLKMEAKKQTVDRHLKQDRYVFMTQTIPEKIRQYEEKQHSEL